ncbi:hypothetical protein ACFYMO_00660 [Streptomyces sp. NPDC007025]|uniref:hypothetical protein n=1 Tax=Streptomyces sp. NPDC007025 TaxID=3364771 RepID=UPI00368790EC
MATSRTTHYVHEDGTVSLRNSKTRVYGWAVEQVRHLHAEAISMKYRAKALVRDLESFERAVATGQITRKSKSWSQGGTYQDFYAVDPETAERHWLGAQVVNAQGQVERSAFDRDEAVEKARTAKGDHVRRVRQEAQELADGPRFAYAIVRWSERRESAAKALKDFRREHAVYRLVEAVEGKPELTPEPVADTTQEDQTMPEPTKDDVQDTTQDLELTEAQTNAMIWARNLESQGHNLINGTGTSVVTVRKLAALGLVTLEEGWDKPWAEGYRKARRSQRVWMATLTEAGRALAARLAGEPQEAAQAAQDAPEAAQEPEAPAEPHTVTMEHVLAGPGEMVTRAWVHVRGEGDPVARFEFPGVLNVFDREMRDLLVSRGWRLGGAVEYLAGSNAFRAPVVPAARE